MAGWRRWRGATNAISKRGQRWDPPWPFVAPPLPELPPRWQKQTGHRIQVPPPRMQRWYPPWPFVEPPAAPEWMPTLVGARARPTLSTRRGQYWSPPIAAPVWVPTTVGTRVLSRLPSIRRGHRWDAPFIEPPPAPSPWTVTRVGARPKWQAPKPRGQQWSPPWPFTGVGGYFTPPHRGRFAPRYLEDTQTDVAPLRYMDATTPRPVNIYVWDDGSLHENEAPPPNLSVPGWSRRIYAGGHMYGPLTEPQVAELVAAGYGVYIHPVPTDPEP